MSDFIRAETHPERGRLNRTFLRGGWDIPTSERVGSKMEIAYRNGSMV